MHACVRLCACYVCVSAFRDQKRALDSLELKLHEVFLELPMWVVGKENLFYLPHPVFINSELSISRMSILSGKKGFALPYMLSIYLYTISILLNYVYFKIHRRDKTNGIQIF